MASASPETESLATAKAVLSTAASVAATVVLARSVLGDLLPYEFHEYLYCGIRNFLSRFSSQRTMVIDEFDGLIANQIYQEAEIYLGQKVSLATRRLRVSKPEDNLSVAVERDETVCDAFRGADLRWTLNLSVLANYLSEWKNSLWVSPILVSHFVSRSLS